MKLWEGIQGHVWNVIRANFEGLSLMSSIQLSIKTAINRGDIMSDVTFSFTIQGDSEGYVTLECPFCGSEFKVQAGEFQSDDNPVIELFCPYCGLTSGGSNFYSKETMEKAQSLVMNYAIEQLNKSFGDISRSINSGGKSIIKMTFKPLKKVNVKELKERDTTEEIFACTCCENHVKVLYCAGASKVFCPYCGVDI